MGDIAIRAEKLAKRYTINVGDAPVNSLSEGVTNAFQRFMEQVRGSAGFSTHQEEIWPLRDASFEIKRGEVVGVIGRNGAGKSTLLKILSRITEPTSGRAIIHGRVGTLLEVGTGFHPELTGRDNIYLSGIILGMRKSDIDKRFDEIVEFAGISKFVDTPVKRYSSGMYVRLAFAVGAHLEPEVLIVDEVLAVGDQQFQQKCLDKMNAIGKEGRTVIFVSHNMQAITRLCQRALLLEKGNLIADGTAHQVVGAYLHSGFSAKASKEWLDDSTAPGNETVRLRAVRIRALDGRVADTIDIRQDFGLEMEFDVLQPGHVLIPNVVVTNEEGLDLFEAFDQDPEWRGVARPAGRYTSTAWIPGNLMSEGTFLASAACICLDPHREHFYEREAAAFQVVDGLHGDSARGDFMGNMIGAIRPLLKWSTRVAPKV